MKFDPKYKKLTGFILIVVAVCLILTGLILSKLLKEAGAKEKEYWFFRESVEKGQPVALENAYILSSENGQIEFIYDLQNYTVKGKLSEDYRGVADIYVSGEKITKVHVNKEQIHVLLKNGTGIWYDDLYIKTLSDQKLIHVKERMEEQELSVFEITDPQGLVLCNADGSDRKPAYEGTFRILRTEQGFVLVNELPIEIYLKYVVPSEMPISFGDEALKAQAVCARTYAYSQMKNTTYALYSANLDDTTDFQVYHNSIRYEQTDRAVDETRGQVIVNNDELISCYFYSTSPGVTNDMSSWQTENVDYIACAGMEFSGNLNLQIASDFSAFIHQSGYSYDAASPYYRWKAVLNVSNLHESEKGRLRGLSIKQRNEAGYITAIELQYENDTIILRNENEIRRILGKYLEQTFLNDETVRNELSMLPSACFEVTESTADEIILQGGGYGHGIGMSQYGAKAIAEAGFDYRAIIDYYYENVEIKQFS